MLLFEPAAVLPVRFRSLPPCRLWVVAAERHGHELPEHSESSLHSGNLGRDLFVPRIASRNGDLTNAITQLSGTRGQIEQQRIAIEDRPASSRDLYQGTVQLFPVYGADNAHRQPDAVGKGRAQLE